MKEGACVFDVGANIGLFTLFVHQKCRNATIYAFEPAPTVFELLRSNVTSYGVNAQLFNIGLSNATKTATLTFYPHSSGMSSFYADRAEEEEVLTTLIQNQILMGNADIEQVMQHSQALLKERFKSQTIVCQLQTLSDVIHEHDLHCIDLLKVDVQKSELDVLLGVKADDWCKIKQIVMEVHDIDGRLDQIIALLKRWGYITTLTQDDLYKGTVIYTVYAIQEEERPL